MEHYITSTITTAVGAVPSISTRLTMKDLVGGWKARWNIDRMDYAVKPGLYAVGKPDKMSAVLVTANYKLTLDTVRRELSGLHLWILVLDTKGINVWCAAGKGTFSTDELVKRINATHLEQVVKHRALILPQLSATGVAAHKIKQQTGFTVRYGPVRARDIPAYLNEGNATPAMRHVEFPAWERLKLTPLELVTAGKTALPILGVLFLLVLTNLVRFSAADLLAFVAAWLAGTVFTPLLLPFVPGRAFSGKGWIVGVLAVCGVMLATGGVSFASGVPVVDATELDAWRIAAWLLLGPAISAFLAMNFTGSSTYTSFPGVLREMKVAVPLILGSALLGSLCLVLGRIVGGIA